MEADMGTLSQELHQEASEGQQSDASTVAGTPHQPLCEPLVGLVRNGEACSVDDFNDKAWLTASELDCQLNRAHSVLFLMAKHYQQASKLEHARHEQQYSAAWPPSEAANLTTPAAASRACELRGEASQTGEVGWCSLQECPSSCAKCRGQRHAATASGWNLIMLPQPFRPPVSTSYAYAKTRGGPRALASEREVSHFDLAKVSRGLWFATVLSDRESFNETEGIFFTRGIQSRLRYVGNDPAIYMEMGSKDRMSSQLCIGADNANIIDGGHRTSFRRAGPDGDRDDGPYWSAPGWYHPAIASQLVVDHANEPMGILKIDVDMKMLTKRFLEGLGVARSAYAAVVDHTGRIIALSRVGLELLFGRNATGEGLLERNGMRACGSRTGDQEELKNCVREGSKGRLTLAGAQKISGANFTPVLERMFDRASNCSEGMLDGRVHFPQAASPADQWHLAAFCAFSSVPKWGLIVAARHADVFEAAHFSLEPDPSFSPNVSFSLFGRSARAKLQVAKGAPEHKFVAFLLRNVGRVALPWTAQLPENASANSFALELLTRPNGSLQPGETLRLLFKISLNGTSKGRHTESIVVKANSEELHGVCFRHPIFIHVTVDYAVPKERSWLQTVVKRHGQKLFYALCGIGLLSCILPLLLRMRREFRRRIKDEHSQQMKIEEALSCLENVAFPMVLMSASAFKRLGALVSHEELLRRHEDLWLHTVEEVKAFSQENQIIFISHQWTGFASPDPTGVQYGAMVMSIETLRAQEGWKEEDMYIWVDYSCIPQRHRGTQTLAINSLMIYASNVAAFVVVAPSVQHADLHDVCDKTTYQCRAWCRAEQLSHLLALGSSRMYLAESGVLTPLADITSWLERATYVFQGDLTCCRREHEGMQQCDKELLVVPMLGLWAKLCETCERQPSGDLVAIRDRIAGSIEEVFPRTFTYARKGRPPKERRLFGDLLEQLPHVAHAKEGGLLKELR